MDLTAINSRLSPEAQAKLAELMAAYQKALRTNRIRDFYPDEGPLRRDLYPKHLEFFRVGAEYRERCFMAANRVGKTEGAGAYESALHMTGEYPDWWEGKRFDKPTRGYVCGKTNETTRDIVQQKLFGQVTVKDGRKSVDGTGLVPGRFIGEITWKQGVADLIDTVKIKHVTGGWSTVNVKSYAQGRGSFEGTERHYIWLDEEPPADVYGECLIRTATTQGIIFITFTPLEGATDVVQSFLPPAMLTDLIEDARRKTDGV